MEIIKNIKKMQIRAENIRLSGKKISFVPTMGFLHEGHLSLVRGAKKIGDVTVVSIFVNPIQFNSSKDLETYPQDIERDLELLRNEKVDLVFIPSVEEMYNQNYQTYIEVTQVTKYLCGATRKGHFKGVTTIVAKLFNIVKPHIAIFGEKDFQQLVTIRKMVEDLNFDIEIIGMPIVRETDGLAMSSRNVHLKGEERITALLLSRSLNESKILFEKGERKSENIKKVIYEILSSGKNLKIDYVEVCDLKNLKPIDEIKESAIIAIAAFVGNTRLIDNIILQLKN